MVVIIRVFMNAKNGLVSAHSYLFENIIYTIFTCAVPGNGWSSVERKRSHLITIFILFFFLINKKYPIQQKGMRNVSHMR